LLPLTVVENPRARRLTLRIEAGGRGLRVTVPPGISPDQIQRFVARQQQWLEGRIALIPDQSVLKAGMSVPLRGVAHRIVAREGLRGLTRATRQEGEPVLEVHGDPAHFGRRIADFLKSEARADLTALVKRHAKTLGVRPGRITLRDTVSRWGSCAASGNLSFSWRIVMAPPAVIDYLAAHEVAHLVHMNHGAAFWETCRSLNPRTDECRAWLRRNGGALHAIPFGTPAGRGD